MSQNKLTLQDWITSSGRYPERANSPELTDDIKKNAQELVDKVNALLQDIGWTEKVSISSGFRPSGVNANVPGAAKRSAHQSGKALDIFQVKPTNKLGLLIREKQKTDKILERHGLMMESLEATVGQNSLWVHIDTVQRSHRPSMEFKP